MNEPTAPKRQMADKKEIAWDFEGARRQPDPLDLPFPPRHSGRT